MPFTPSLYAMTIGQERCRGVAMLLFGHNLHPAASLAMACDAYLSADAFVQFLTVGDYANAAVGLPGYVLQFFQSGHYAVQAFFVEGAEPFVDEEDVHVEVGSVER